MHLSDFEPDSFDYLEMEKKGFIDNNDVNEKFSIFYKRYYSYLEKYLDEIIDINKTDNLVETNQNNFQAVNKEDMDIYQDLSSFKYFYIRNTLYIEKLNEEEIKLLEEKDSYDSEVHDLISNTYKKVITTSTPVINANINYGPKESNTYYAESNALVIGFRYDPLYSKEAEDDDIWFDKYTEQQFLITRILKDLEQDIREKIDIPIKVIKYNEFSVKKKDITLEGKVK